MNLAWQGRRQTMVLAPDKIKIQKVLAAKEAQEKIDSATAQKAEE